MLENTLEEINQNLAEIRDILKKAITKNTINNELIDRKVLIKRLGITEPTAIKFGRKGKIPEIRVGGSVRYNWTDVINSLKNYSH